MGIHLELLKLILSCMNYVVSFHFLTYILIKRTNGIGKFILFMGGIINISGLHAVIPGLDNKPTILVLIMLLLVIINALSTLRCNKQTEIKLKVIL